MNRYQTIGPRIVATIIDTIVFIPVIVLTIWIYGMQLPDLLHFGAVLLITVVTNSYYILMHWKYGQTLGKMVAKVKVLDISENPITLWQATVRDIFSLVHGLGTVLMEMSLVFLLGYTRTSDTYISIEGYSLLPVYLWTIVDVAVCLKSKKSRALHDLMAGTVVVRTEVPPDTEDGLNYEPPGPDLYDELRNDRV